MCRLSYGDLVNNARVYFQALTSWFSVIVTIFK